MLLESKNLYSEIETKNFRPVYFIYGEEDFLQGQILNQFRSHVVPEGFEDFNVDIYYADDVDADKIIDAVMQIPMMTSHRLVVLRNADQLKDSDWQMLETVLENPSLSTVFVLFASVIDKRKKSIKKFLDQAACVEVKKPYDNQIPQWIHYLAKSLEIKFGDDCVSEIHRRVGGQLSSLYLALQRLKNYVDAGQPIYLKDVIEVLPRSKEESVFEFIKLLGMKKKTEALQAFHEVMGQGQSGVGLVLLIARQLRLLLQLKFHQKQGLYGATLAGAIQVPPYFLQEYLQQSTHWNEHEIEQAIASLSQLELQLKTSAAQDSTLIENFILRF